MALQRIEAASYRQVAKVDPVRLNGDDGQCIRIIAGGRPVSPFVAAGSAATKKREFRICAIGGSGQPASLQISTPDVRAPGEPYGIKSRTLLIGDVNKMCRHVGPQVSYEEDLEPFKANIGELHGVRPRRKPKKRR